MNSWCNINFETDISIHEGGRFALSNIAFDLYSWLSAATEDEVAAEISVSTTMFILWQHFALNGDGKMLANTMTPKVRARALTLQEMIQLEKPKFSDKFLGWLSDRLSETLRERLAKRNDVKSIEMLEMLLVLMLQQNQIASHRGLIETINNSFLMQNVADISWMIDPWGNEEAIEE